MEKDKNSGPFEQIGETVGGTVGRVVGRAQDMAMNAAGSLISAAVSTLGEWWASADAQQASRTFDQRADQACRSHFESRAGAAGSRTSEYASARPLYEFGFVASANPEYQSKPFDRVEADLEKAWEELGRDRYGDWSQVRDQVSFGYTYRSGGAPNPS